MLEGAQEVAALGGGGAQVTFGGDVDHVGGSEALRQLVCNVSSPEEYLDAPSRAAMRLTIKVRGCETLVRCCTAL
jgi:hypothetical protein